MGVSPWFTCKGGYNMKQIIRRLTALALCAILMMAMPLASAQELMTASGLIDLLIPRGGAGLIRAR